MTQTPRLFHDTLVYEQQGQTLSLHIGSAEWRCWLSTASAFTLVNDSGSFTTRKERAGSNRGGWYWKMYHRQNAKLRSAYVGKTEELTLERLTSVAQRLTISQPLLAPTSEKSSDQDALASTWATHSRNSLPLPLTPLIGREHEVFALENMLAQQERRLVTITGTGV